MSTEEFKRVDRIIQWCLKGLITIGVAAVGIVGKGVYNDVAYTKAAVGAINLKLEHVETKLTDHIELEKELSKKRDDQIERIQRTLDALK